MALYCYKKAKPTYTRYVSTVRTTHHSQSGISLRTFVSTSLGVAGLFLIVWVSYPILSFELTSRTKYTTSAQTPENDSQVLSDQDSDTTRIDYTKISNWLPNTLQNTNLAGRVYYLTIPKLRIFDATVKIAGENLDQSLIHYGGTGLPGDYGTSVIFGHSILPQFYDPKNYKSIFSLLPKLEEGDEIFTKYDAVTYRYVVSSMRITKPNDISVLEQKYDNSYIRLITCVPPGTYWKRLEVTAKLEKM